jgi:hypothetical protein
MFILGLSLRWTALAFKAIRARIEPPASVNPAHSISQSAFEKFVAETTESFNELKRQFQTHETTTSRIEDNLREMKAKLDLHIAVGFRAQEERLQIVERATESFFEDQRRKNVDVRQRLGRLEEGSDYRPSPGFPKRD